MVDINGVMMQYFHWYVPDDGTLWEQVKYKAKELAEAGFTALWLPPAYKGIDGGSDVGYGVYDIYDLGEFNQKGSIRTKYGTRQQYLDAIAALHETRIQVYADVVLNHRMGADLLETFKATPYPQDNRLSPKGKLQEIKSYTHFTFPERQGKYSKFEWHWWHFDAVDYNEYKKDDRGTVYLIEGKQFDDCVSLEKGNYAYLMGCDLDFQDKWVRQEVIDWGKWYLDTTGVDGFRLDAVKHIAAWFFPQWLEEMEGHAGKELFAVGEYWVPDINTLDWYVDTLSGKLSIFAVSLHYKFHRASRSGRNYDLRQILNDTLMQQRPGNAVTFVSNHDTQAMQALESVVEPWFKPLAYAIILLRVEGYPCIFYPDYYGAEYEDYGRDGSKYKIVMPSHRLLIDKFLHARKNYAYGPQYDYLDRPNTIGWTRLGDEDHPQAMAVILSNGTESFKRMEVGKPSERFIDITEHIKYPIYTNEKGWAKFPCLAGSVSVWVEELPD